MKCKKMVNIGGLRVYSVLTIEGIKLAFADDIKRIEEEERKEKQIIKNAAGKTYSYIVKKDYIEEGEETSYFLTLPDAAKHYQAIKKNGRSKLVYDETTDYKKGELIKSIVLKDMYGVILASYNFEV